MKELYNKNSSIFNIKLTDEQCILATYEEFGMLVRKPLRKIRRYEQLHIYTYRHGLNWWDFDKFEIETDFTELF